jgi:outer membrane protein insertion porin family
LRLLPVLFLLAVSTAAALPINEIRVEGNVFVSDTLIVQSMGLPIGGDLVTASISRAIRNLYRMGYFSQVEVLADTIDAGVDLVVEVDENPILSDYRFENPGDLDVDDVRDSLRLFPGRTVSVMDIERAKRIIMHFYREDHRHHARVAARWEQPGLDGRSALVFECDQGPEIKVGEIDFVGNTVFTDDDLRDEMKTKQDSFWRSGRFRESDFSEDLGKIEEHYSKHGYPYARVLDVDRSMLPDSTHMRLRITVEEGRHYDFGRVTLTGNARVPDSVLVRAMDFEAGDEYDSEKLQKTLEKMYEILQNRGYFYAEVVPEVLSENDSILGVDFMVSEGERAHIRRVDIVGNTRTHDNVIRRELKIYPGDLFQRTSLVRSLRNVYYLNYFKDVIPDFRMIEGSSDVDLILQVEEKSTGKAGIGAGYSAEYGLNGYIELGEDNLLGRGQRVSLNYQFSKRTQDIELGFTEPWFRDTPLTLGCQLFHTTANRSEYDRRRTGGAVIVGRPLPWIDYTSLSARYMLEKVDVFNITDDSTSFYYDLRDTDWPRWTSSIRFTLSRDSRDRKIFPGWGSDNSLTAEFAGGALGGNIGFQKYLVDSSWYLPVFWKFFLTLRTRAGAITSLAGREPPAYELFELGGTGFYGVRGYDDNTIGASSGYQTVGGRTMLIFSCEYRFRVIDQLQLALFADAGNTWNSWADSDFWDLNRGAGMGVRVEVPMLGIIGFDYAYGFDGPNRGWSPHFQIGTEF